MFNFHRNFAHFKVFSIIISFLLLFHSLRVLGYGCLFYSWQSPVWARANSFQVIKWFIQWVHQAPTTYNMYIMCALSIITYSSDCLTKETHLTKITCTQYKLRTVVADCDKEPNRIEPNRNETNWFWRNEKQWNDFIVYVFHFIHWNNTWVKCEWFINIVLAVHCQLSPYG